MSEIEERHAIIYADPRHLDVWFSETTMKFVRMGILLANAQTLKYFLIPKRWKTNVSFLEVFSLWGNDPPVEMCSGETMTTERDLRNDPLHSQIQSHVNK